MKIIRFGALWCPGCLVMKRVWSKVEEEYNIETNDYDYDLDKDLVDKFSIGKVLPVTIFLDENDRELERIIGEVKKEEIIKIINKYKG